MNNKEKIMQVLFENPGKEFHIRLLARETKLNPNTIINITKHMEEEGLLIRKKDDERHLVILKAAADNRIFKLRKRMYNLEKIFSSGIVDYLEDVLSYPTIILFGSYAKAENHINSDVDLFIIAEHKKELDLSKYENKLAAEIQVFVHTKEEFKKLKKTNSELMNNVVNGIILSGFLEVF